MSIKTCAQKIGKKMNIENFSNSQSLYGFSQEFSTFFNSEILEFTEEEMSHPNFDHENSVILISPNMEKEDEDEYYDLLSILNNTILSGIRRLGWNKNCSPIEILISFGFSKMDIWKKYPELLSEEEEKKLAEIFWNSQIPSE